VPCVVEEVADVDEDSTNALLRKSCESRFEIAMGAGVHNNQSQTQRARGRLQVCDDRLRVRRARVCENAEHGSVGYQLAEQLQSFRRQLGL
jgi:hypothetical protein